MALAVGSAELGTKVATGRPSVRSPNSGLVLARWERDGGGDDVGGGGEALVSEGVAVTSASRGSNCPPPPSVAEGVNDGVIDGVTGELALADTAKTPPKTSAPFAPLPAPAREAAADGGTPELEGDAGDTEGLVATALVGADAAEVAGGCGDGVAAATAAPTDAERVAVADGTCAMGDGEGYAVLVALSPAAAAATRVGAREGVLDGVGITDLVTDGEANGRPHAAGMRAQNKATRCL